MDADTWEFVDCTCEHQPENHDLIECDVKDCPCGGGWAWNDDQDGELPKPPREEARWTR